MALLCALLAGAQATATPALAMDDPGTGCVSLRIPEMPHAGWNYEKDEPCSFYDGAGSDEVGVQPGAGFYGNGAIFGEEEIEIRDPPARDPQVSTPPFCPTVSSCRRTPTAQRGSDPDRPRAGPRDPKPLKAPPTRAEKERSERAKQEAQKARCREFQKNFNDRYYSTHPASTARPDLIVAYYRRREQWNRIWQGDPDHPFLREAWNEDPKVEAALKTWDARGCSSALGEDLGERRSRRIP